MRSSGLVLFVCAGLLLSGGAILGGSTAWNLLRMSYYFWTSELGAELGSCVLFVAGALLCLPACWLATLVPYHPKSLSLLATLMGLVTVSKLLLAMGLLSVAGVSRAVREPTVLNSSMMRAMAYDALDPAVRSSFAAMQIELKCCGVQSYTDWYKHRRTLPPSCCGRVWNGKRGDLCEVPLHAVGCLHPALSELRGFINSLSALACGMIVIMAVTLFAASYTLVTAVVDRTEARVFKPLQPLRIACLNPHAPLVSLTSPAALSNPPPQM